MAALVRFKGWKFGSRPPLWSSSR